MLKTKLNGDREAKRAVGERSAAVAAPAEPAGVPAPELAERPKRRRFTAECKLAILREADACTKPGATGALLRREGLYVETNAGAAGAVRREPCTRRRRGARGDSNAAEIARMTFVNRPARPTVADAGGRRRGVR